MGSYLIAVWETQSASDGPSWQTGWEKTERDREREMEMWREVGRKLAAEILRFMVTAGCDAGLTSSRRTLTVRQTGGR